MEWNLIMQEMVLLPDWVGGRETVVKQGMASESGRGEKGRGGGREVQRMAYCMSAHGGCDGGGFCSLPCKSLPHGLFHLAQK